MKFQFADRIAHMRQFEVDDTLDRMSDSSQIFFSAGNPAPEVFPVEEVKLFSKEALESKPLEILAYSHPTGTKSIKAAYTAFLNRIDKNVCENDGVLITGGSQQTLDLLIRSLCNEGDTVLCESPTFMAALDTMRASKAETVGVELERDGISVSDLESKLSAKKKPKLLYIIPDFQNPSGITMSLEKRRAVCALAAKYGVPVLEDNPYGDLRFAGEHIPSMKSMDKNGVVIYAASMSKIAGPGLRTACVVAPKELIAAMTELKTICDIHNNVWAQEVSAMLLSSDMDKRIERMREIYGKRCAAMLSAIDRHFDKRVETTRPEGGLFIWCTLPNGCDMKAFVSEGQKRGVSVVPGNIFLADSRQECRSFRLCFSTASLEEIEKGIEILGGITREICGR